MQEKNAAARRHPALGFAADEASRAIQLLVAQRQQQAVAVVLFNELTEALALRRIEVSLRGRQDGQHRVVRTPRSDSRLASAMLTSLMLRSGVSRQLAFYLT